MKTSSGELSNLRMPIDDSDPRWRDYYIPLKPGWLMDSHRMREAEGLRDRMEETIRNAFSQKIDLVAALQQWLDSEERRGRAGFPQTRDYAVMFFLVVLHRRRNNAPVVTIREYVESIGFGLESDTTLQAGLSSLTSAAGIKAHEEAARRIELEEQDAIVQLNRWKHIGNTQRIIYTLVLTFAAAPIIAELGAIGIALSIANQSFHFMIEYYRVTKDGKIEGGEWIALVLSVIGFIPIARLQKLLGGAGLGLTVTEFFDELYMAAEGVDSVSILSKTIEEMGGFIHPGANFGRLGGDILDGLLEGDPKLRDVIGRSTEAEVRAKVLNSVVQNASRDPAKALQSAPQAPSVPANKLPKAIADAYPLPKELPGGNTEILALESLDHRKTRNFEGKSPSNPFKANNTSNMPRRFTYIVKSPILNGGPGSPPFRYERIVVSMEHKLTVGEKLQTLIGTGSRRPDYATMRYEMSAEEIAAVTKDGKIGPNFRDAIKKLPRGHTFTAINAVIKSIDFNTFLSPKAALNHVKKHVETFTKFAATILGDYKIQLKGKLRILLRDWYHNSPWVYQRRGKSHLTLSPRNPAEIETGSASQTLADPNDFSHTIQLESEIDERNRIGKYVPIKNRPGTGIHDTDFARAVRKLKRSLRVVIGKRLR